VFDTQWTPLFHDQHFGIWPLIAGTGLTAGIAMLVAVPLGLLAAIYLSEFAPPLLRRYSSRRSSSWRAYRPSCTAILPWSS
jgi:ABC-type phosphate transport system permease subunit